MQKLACPIILLLIAANIQAQSDRETVYPMMEIVMPVQKTEKVQTPVDTTILTVIITAGDPIYYYAGKNQAAMEETDFSENGIRKILVENSKKTSVGYRVVIKATENAKYDNLIAILDELQIAKVQRYAIADISPEELEIIGKMKDQD